MYFYRTVDKNTLNLASTEQTIVPLGLYQVKLNPLPFSPKAIYEFDNSELRDTKKMDCLRHTYGYPPSLRSYICR